MIAADRWETARRLVVLALAAVVLATFRDYGPGWDAQFQAQYGSAILGWFASGFRDPTALTYFDTRYYGGLFEAFLQLAVAASPFGKYETRHLLTAASALLAIAVAGRLARRIGGPRAGFAATVLLAATPAFFCHGFVNSKDVPFAAAAAASLLALLRALEDAPPARVGRTWIAALALGAAMAIRPGGAPWLLFLAAAAFAVRAVQAARASPAQRGRIVRGSATRLVAIFAGAWAVMIAAWPWGLVSPVLHPLEAMAVAARFPWPLAVRFDGALLRASELSRWYVPRSLAMALPEAWLLALAAGAAVAIAAHGAHPRRGEILFLAAAALGPLAAAVLLRPVVYDQGRHFLFVLVPLAALAGAGLSAAVDRFRSLGIALAGIAALLVAATAVEMGVLHPYEYVYFNRALGGGLARAADRYETDYWGLGYREATRWVMDHVPSSPGAPLRLATCGRRFQAGYWVAQDPSARERFEIVEWWEAPDLLLATTRLDCHVDAGLLLHSIDREGVPLVFVFDRRAPEDRPAPEPRGPPGASPRRGGG